MAAKHLCLSCVYLTLFIRWITSKVRPHGPSNTCAWTCLEKNAWRWSGRVKGYKLLGLFKLLLCDPHGAAVLNVPEKVEGTTWQRWLRAGREEARPHFPVPTRGRAHHTVGRAGRSPGFPIWGRRGLTLDCRSRRDALSFCMRKRRHREECPAWPDVHLDSSGPCPRPGGRRAVRASERRDERGKEEPQRPRSEWAMVKIGVNLPVTLGCRNSGCGGLRETLSPPFRPLTCHGVFNVLVDVLSSEALNIKISHHWFVE